MKRIIVSLMLVFVVTSMVWAQNETIQELIDEAVPGEDVIVFPGEYEEDLVLNKSIQLTGENVTLNGTVYITADDAGFGYFTITEYGVMDGQPVVRITGDSVDVFSNTFIKTEDAIEIVIEGKNANVAGNVINGTITTDSGMVEVGKNANNTVLYQNEFLGGRGGQWGPLQIFAENGTIVNLSDNTFKNVSDKAILSNGLAAVLNFNNNSFSDVGVIYIGQEPISLNGFSDMQIAEENVENTNNGSEVVYGFLRNISIQALIDAGNETLTLPTGFYEEDFIVNKSIQLIGENVMLSGKITIASPNVTISGFRFRDGMNDEEPVIKIEEGPALIADNYFDTKQDAVEILVEADDVHITDNMIYSGAEMERTWRMILVSGNNTNISDNSFLGSSSYGIFSPILFTNVTKGMVYEVKDNLFSNVDDTAISITGEGASFSINENIFNDIGRISFSEKPGALNGFTDIELGVEDIENNNTGAEVVLEYLNMSDILYELRLNRGWNIVNVPALLFEGYGIVEGFNSRLAGDFFATIEQQLQYVIWNEEEMVIYEPGDNMTLPENVTEYYVYMTEPGNLTIKN